jgi:tetraacyldisaccharide 4'-kinase
VLDHLYRHAMRARRAWYAGRPDAVRRLDRPVIAVGNLSVGGTGKTPLVAAIASRLVALGERPAILSRGYGRRRATAAPVVVSSGTQLLAPIEDAGDEPMLLARRVPGAIVVVGANRHASGRLAERTFGATIHLLDDGFQHVQLARDVDVLVTTPGEIAEGRVLPFGRLREGAEAAMHADVLVVVGASASEAAAEGRPLGVRSTAGATRVLGAAELVTPDGGEEMDLERLREEGTAVVAVAGIAHPARFFDDLEVQGWQVVRRMPFADHHWFTGRDLTRIAAAVAETRAGLVLTTEKDAVKFEALLPLAFPLARVPMRVDIEPPSAIDAWIARARAGRDAVPAEDAS